MRNFISILLLILLFILTPVVLTLNTAKQTILTTNFIKHELVKLDVYHLVTSRIDQQIQTVKIDPTLPITNSDISTLAHQVFSDRWLQQSVELTLDDLDTWLHAPRGTNLSVMVNLQQPKQHLLTGIDVLLAAKPPTIKPCQPKEDGICKFSGLTVAQAKTELGRNGLSPETFTSKLPDQLDLLNPDLSKLTGQTTSTDSNSTTAKTKEIRHNLDQVKARYQQVSYLLVLSLIIWGLVFLLYLAMNDTGWHHFIRWGGVGFLIISIFPLAAALSSGVLAEFLIPKIQMSADTPADIARLIPLVIRDAQLALALPLGMIGGISFGLGLGGIVGAHWVRVTTKKPKLAERLLTKAPKTKPLPLR